MDLRVPSAQCILQMSENPGANTIGFSGKPCLHSPIDWPQCSACGQTMDFIAQLPLRSPLTLSKSWDMAYVFCCPGEYDERKWLKCPTWEPGRGTNAVILQRRAKTPAPSPDTGPLLTARLELAFEPDQETYDKMEAGEMETPADVHFDDLIWEHIKLGGTPSWYQDVEEPACPVCAKSMSCVAMSTVTPT